MTYREAINKGYVDADWKWTRGYVSRKNFDINDAEVYEAGGKRKGQLYVLVPSWDSTEYCFRQYLRKPKK